MTTATIEKQTFSIFGTFLWIFALAFGVQSVLGLFISIGLGMSGMEDESISKALEAPILLGTVGLAAALLTMPLFKIAAYRPEKGFPYQFIGVKPIQRSVLLKVLAAGLVFGGIEHLALEYIDIAEPQFLLDIKAQTHNALDLIMVIIAIAIVAPIIEELIFRGIAYTRFVKSRAGVTGAIIITSLLFGVVHFQYEFTIMAIIAIWALFLGYVRYKTDNVVYCIALHMLNNTLAIIYLYLFM